MAPIRRRILRKLLERIETEGLFYALPEKIRRTPNLPERRNLLATGYETRGRKRAIGRAEMRVVNRRRARNFHTAIDKKGVVSRWL